MFASWRPGEVDRRRSPRTLRFTGHLTFVPVDAQIFPGIRQASSGLDNLDTALRRFVFPRG
ncbi:hypothetical protein CHELA1G11_11534 [Hyphomicrobiales bacterium]|nr:hypothetical protein CHELA1G11_11534 [Hyphomicrobiales bacterium]CAH1667090.1 hypothetical protein CHELA1G2_12775 [Hyphomicrobiales bacterium]